MDPVAQADVRRRRKARHVETVGVGEDSRIAVRRSEDTVGVAAKRGAS